MKLLEIEGKDLLSENGLEVPRNNSESGYVVKAQVFTSDRKAKDGIKFCNTLSEAEKIAEKMKSDEIDGFPVKDVLIEEKLDINKEFYVSFLYDTDSRSPMMLFSSEGGSNIEERDVSKLIIEHGHSFEFREFLVEQNIRQDVLKLSQTMQKLYNCFKKEDLLLLEVNPLAKTEKGFICTDVVIELDEDANFRHDRDYPERSVFNREKTIRELKAKKIDENDHRGIAGKYIELDGDIGMILAGGGASLTNMDALIKYGGKPANYTEYGGNPPTEKVYKLSKIIMSKPGLKGLWHVGGTANNTDIYRTMKGFCNALEEEQPKYPIVVRRDGPNADKAFELLRNTREKSNLNMKLFRKEKTMTESAKILMEMIEQQND